MTGPAAPVQEITTSAAASAAGRSASPLTVVPAVPTLAATRSACSLVRLATAMLAAPLRAAVAAARALIEPAPTMSTRRPASASVPDRPGGELDRGAQQAEAGPADRGLGPGPLAGAQREPPELAEHPAGGAVLRRQLDRRAHLAEDLVLADHHRVEAGRHREQMADRPLLVVHVQVRGELGRRHPAVPGEQFADGRDAARGSGPRRRTPRPGCRWRRRRPRPRARPAPGRAAAW